MKLDFNDLNFGDIEQRLDDSCFHPGQNEIVYFPGLLTPRKARSLRRFLFNHCAGFLSRKDFLMASSDDTPRHMSVVGGIVMNKIPLIGALYDDPRLLAILNDVMRHSIEFDQDDGENAVIPYDDPLENIVVTCLEKDGDTHGQHIDVPAVTFVICLENVTEECGGHMEYTRFFRSFVASESLHLKAGDAYVFNSNRHPHCVTPIGGGGKRTILNFTYDFQHRMTPPMQDGSAELLFS